MREIGRDEFSNIFKLIGKDWMLITAERDGKVNCMTASWGTAGILWNKPVCTVFIRPQRYTYGLVEDGERLSLSFFGGEYRRELGLCGRLSGRDGDKLAEVGFHAEHADGVPYIGEASTVLICRKLYADDLREDKFILPEIVKEHYCGDFHRFYILEVEKILTK